MSIPPFNLMSHNWPKAIYSQLRKPLGYESKSAAKNSQLMWSLSKQNPVKHTTVRFLQAVKSGTVGHDKN